MPSSRPSNDDNLIIAQQTELARLIERHTRRDGTHPTTLAPLWLYRASAPSEMLYDIYEPALCIIAQGRKHSFLAEQLYQYDPAHFLLGSVDLPVVSQIVGATPDAPYLCLRLHLDPKQIGALVVESDMPPAPPASGSALRGLSVNRVDSGLLDAVVRLLRLLDTPRDANVLAPLVMREIFYRLLIGPEGDRLQRMVLDNGETQRIARAIHWLKTHYTKAIRTEDIAREACMSTSALFHHFKAVTAMSPLQFQKQLRLQEARRLMLGDTIDAATASYRVGYESPSQFSREYSRLFGAPPGRDIANLRTMPSAKQS